MKKKSNKQTGRILPLHCETVIRYLASVDAFTDATAVPYALKHSTWFTMRIYIDYITTKYKKKGKGNKYFLTEKGIKYARMLHLEDKLAESKNVAHKK